MMISNRALPSVNTSHISTLMYIDTHCHLNYPELYEDRKSIIERAYTAGVNQIITIGTDIESSEICIKIAEEFDSVYAAVGIHPTDLQSAKKGWRQELIQLAKHPKVKAIGEVGLDYYWDTTKP
ncbi:MAG: TatD family hydrolase, partial [Candidatus Marinimicrobia bacterium]|nr:TatD family hydrolase [Candidatus Neomarinimicrobiota bacterium]